MMFDHNTFKLKRDNKPSGVSWIITPTEFTEICTFLELEKPPATQTLFVPCVLNILERNLLYQYLNANTNYIQVKDTPNPLFNMLYNAYTTTSQEKHREAWQAVVVPFTGMMYEDPGAFYVIREVPYGDFTAGWIRPLPLACNG